MTKPIERLYVLYDRDCGLCRRCRDWLEAQPAYLKLEFVPLQDPGLEERFPGVGRFRPEEELLAISDRGAVYRGGKAWVMCLWALKDYRGWSERLAAPALLPLVRRFCGLVSENRLNLSKLFRERGDADLASALDRAEGVPASTDRAPAPRHHPRSETAGCHGGSCGRGALPGTARRGGGEAR